MCVCVCDLSCCCFLHISSTLLLDAFTEDWVKVSSRFLLLSRLLEMSAENREIIYNIIVYHKARHLYTSKCSQ